MQVKLGVWSVGNDSDPGTIAWAGGLPDWEAGPYKALFSELRVQDYMGFCNETDGGYMEYQYDERTVGWQNIRIAGCKARPGAELQTPSAVESDAPRASKTGEPHAGEESRGFAMRSSRAVGGCLVLGLAWLLIM